jgi:hypothetical protein
VASYCFSFLPEKKTENWEGTDVSSTAADSSESSSNETGKDQNDGLPDSEVGDRIVSHSFVLPRKGNTNTLF